VSRKYGNQGARKIGPEQSAWLVSMYAQPNKPDTHKVWTAYTQEALVRNWPVLTESAITKHLMRPDLRPLWTLGRHGKAPQTLHFPKDRQWVGYGMGHLELMNRPEVYSQLHAWMQEPA
jgi:hypothetical protein